MKVKISILFLILAVALVFVTFKKEWLLGPSQEESNTQIALREFSKKDVFDFLYQSKFVSYSGESLELTQAKIDASDIITIHFWASWCAPCVNEVPELIDFAKRVSVKNPKDLKTLFIAVSLDDVPEDLSKFLKSFPDFNKDLFVKIWDKDKSFSKLVDADRLPMTIILNKKISEPRVVRGVVEWKSIDF